MLHCSMETNFFLTSCLLACLRRVSRMQTSLRRRHRDRVVRRGLALIIESDFVRPGRFKLYRTCATSH